MASILIVTEKDCYPVSDGVSIAIESISTILSAHNVSYYMYGASIFKQDKKTPGIRRLASDLPEFDIILASPINATHYFLRNKKEFKYKKSIALLSDCYTYAIWKQIILAFKFNFSKSRYIAKTILRLISAYFKELRIAYAVDLALLQTTTDTRIFKRIFPFSKVDNIPNIPDSEVNADDKSIIERDVNDIAFVASFVGSYLYIADWFFKNVWPAVSGQNKDARIHLLGKGSEAYYNRLIKEDNNLKQSLIIEDYYPDISVFFRRMHMSVSPVFKGYGLINKTVEAMLNGCITIGDRTAFNGLGEVVSGHDCFIANNAGEFIDAINSNFNSKHLSMRKNASDLINNILDKAKYTEKINVIIKELLN